MSRTDDLLRMEDALTREQRETFLKRWAELNPSWNGALVADVLDSLEDTDSHIRSTDPFWEQHSAKMPKEDWRLYHLAILCLIYTGQIDPGAVPTWEQTDALVQKAKTVWVR